MNVTIFGATGGVGSECLKQTLEAGHHVTVLVRDASKLDPQYQTHINIIEGDALNRADVDKALEGSSAVLFAIGVGKQTRQNICTDATRHILEVMRAAGSGRFIWCGGGNSFVKEDQLSMGAWIIRLYAAAFLKTRHVDKENQYLLLQEYRDVDWLGVRPVKIEDGPKTETYALGFVPFGPSSSISYADVAHAMISMLDDNTWLHKAPIIRYDSPSR